MVACVGDVIVPQQAWSLPDPPGKLVADVDRLNQNCRSWVGPVMVDSVGIGFHIPTHLTDHGYEVYGFNAGGTPIDSEHFVNANAEAYWALRRALEHGAVTGLADEETHAQLAGFRYQHMPAGHIEIESKEDTKKRGQQSPDRADSLVLAFTRPVPRKTMVLTTPVTISAV
jgi:hypothetical protein